MNSSVIEIQQARAQQVQVSEDALVIELVDGRTVTVPLTWYPRLWYGTPKEREHFELLGEGSYIHWPELDEDLSIEGVIMGRRSGESSRSLKKWLKSREK